MSHDQRLKLGLVALGVFIVAAIITPMVFRSVPRIWRSATEVAPTTTESVAPDQARSFEDALQRYRATSSLSQSGDPATGSGNDPAPGSGNDPAPGSGNDPAPGSGNDPAPGGQPGAADGAAGGRVTDSGGRAGSASGSSESTDQQAYGAPARAGRTDDEMSALGQPQPSGYCEAWRALLAKLGEGNVSPFDDQPSRAQTNASLLLTTRYDLVDNLMQASTPEARASLDVLVGLLRSWGLGDDVLASVRRQFTYYYYGFAISCGMK